MYICLIKLPKQLTNQKTYLAIQKRQSKSKVLNHISNGSVEKISRALDRFHM